MRRFLLICFISISEMLTFESVAQCDACRLDPSDNPDFCYVDSNFEGYCASFNDAVPSFKLVTGKKSRTVPLEVEPKPELDYFLKLSKGKEFKLSATDLLFIQEALKVWELEARKIGYELTPSGLGIKIIRQQGSFPLDASLK